MGKLAILLTIALLWGGGQGVYEGLTNRTPESVSCEQANKTPPKSTWVHLTGCKVNLLEAVYKTRFGKQTDDVFLPLTAAGAGETKTVRFVLETTDPNMVAVVKELSALDPKDEAALFAYMAKNVKRMILDKDVTGMVQSGIMSDDKINQQLKTLNKDLAPDFVVVDESKEPSLGWPAFLLTSGVALFLYQGSRVLARIKA